MNECPSTENSLTSKGLDLWRKWKVSKVLDTDIKLKLVTLLRGLKFSCWVGIIVAYISLYLPLVAKKENFKNTKVHSTPKELQVTRKLGLILKTSSDSCETPFKTFPLLLLWGVGRVKVPNSLISNKPLRSLVFCCHVMW